MKHKIAVAQFEIKIGFPVKNIDKGLAFVDQAIQQQARLIVLPELWTSGYDLENCNRYILINQDVLAELHSRSNQSNILIGGSYITQDAVGYRNTFYLIQPNVTGMAEYHKIHLFRQLKEPQFFMPGSAVTIRDTPLGRAGFAICYDVRFPEMFRAFCRQRVELILIAAEWGLQRTAHWRNLLRARAIENQAFVLAANSVGPLLDTAAAGYSTVIDPWGEALVEADGSEEKLLMTDIDLDAIKTAGEKIPSRDDARNDLYADWLSL